MSKTHLKKTSFLMSIFRNFGSQLGSHIRKLKSKNRPFFAILGQLGPTWAKRACQEGPRDPKWGPKALQDRQNDAKRRPKTTKMTQKCTTKPSHYQSKSHKTFSQQTGDTSNWWPTAPNIKREWPPTRNRWHTKLVTHRACSQRRSLGSL